jgi:serine protease AprX
LSAVTWLAPPVVDAVRERFPNWDPTDGACPDCARLQLQRVLTELSLSPPKEAPSNKHLPAWECLPTTFRVAADPRFTGSGITMAIIDAAFYPHPDLIKPRNRIRAWVDATVPRLRAIRFKPDDIPRWPDWDKIAASQWHGLMASGIATGNGRLSHGLYRGLASEAEVILVQTMDARHRITNPTLEKALRWLRKNAEEFRLNIVNFSVAGDPVVPLPHNIVDVECERLVKMGVTLVAAVGNTARPSLVPPSTCPEVISVGGIDDRDRIDPEVWRIWHSNYGTATDGSAKPHVVAPSWRVVAPLLPRSSVAAEAKELFARRLLGDRTAEPRIDDQKLVTPYYQHMDGTSVAAPIVSGIVAGMLQANPDLTPIRIRELLMKSARSVVNAPVARQGAGAVQAAKAIALALAERKHRKPLGRRRRRD